MNNMEIVTHQKTASIRVVGDDTKLKLFGMFDCITAVSGQIKDKMYALKENEQTREIYADYLKQPSRGRSCATTIMGSDRITKSPEEAQKAWESKQQQNKLEGKKVKTTYDSFKKHGGNSIFPMYVAPSDGINLRSSGYTYSVNAGVHTQLDSLEQCEALVKSEYNTLKKEVEQLKKIIKDEFPEFDFTGYYSWIETLKSLGWAYDANFYNFFTQKMLAALKSNTEWTVTYKIGDKNKRYKFFNLAVIDEIKNHSEHWDALANHDVLKYYKAKLKFAAAKETANYSKTTLLKAPVRVTYANNGVKFSIVSDNKYAYLSFALPSQDGNKPETIQVKCAYRKYNHLGQPRKSCYLDGLVVEPNGNGKYLCNYSVNGKRPQVAHLNECFLRLKVINKTWFNKYVNGTLTAADGTLQASYFDFYFDLSMGVEETQIHNLDKNEVFGKKSLRSYYSTSYPDNKDLGNQSTIQVEFACPVDKPHILIGIDAGIRNPFAYCVKDNNGVEIVRGHLDGCQDDYYKTYKEFTNKSERIVQLLQETKNFLYGDDEAFDVANMTSLGIKLKDYIAYLTPNRSLVVIGDESKTTTYTMRRDAKWIVKDILYALTKEFKALKLARMKDSDWRRAIYWVETINGMINAQKAFHNFGSYYDKNNKCRVNGTAKGFANNYYDELRGANEDMFKKFANALLPIIKKYGVSVVVMENMDALRGNSDKSTIENQIYNLWPIGQLKTFLEGMLASYNVAIVEVSEQNTSQVYKGRWVERREDNLYLDGQLLDVHADENAAENIVNRALCHHTDLYSLYMVNPMDNYWIPASLWSPKEKGGARVRGCWSKIYGSSDVVLLNQNGTLSKSNMTVKDLKKIVTRKSVFGKHCRRLDGDKWMLVVESK